MIYKRLYLYQIVNHMRDIPCLSYTNNERANVFVRVYGVYTYCKCLVSIPNFFHLNGLSCYCLVYTDKNQNIWLHTHLECFKWTTQRNTMKLFRIEIETVVSSFSQISIEEKLFCRKNLKAEQMQIKITQRSKTVKIRKKSIKSCNFRIHSFTSFQQTDCFASESIVSNVSFRNVHSQMARLIWCELIGM